ncbi:MAG: DUF4080 domain-containing protein [Candidatus Hydrogenedentes bacterium]|nr:DUF4080 domain-containing protein [Candidatus Hydrogenedentota bacterium]
MDVLLTTANARYTHCAFGLKCLAAALEATGHTAHIQEFTIQHAPYYIVEELLAQNPTVIGLGVYIWNIDLMARVIHILHAIAPGITLIVGGPETFGDGKEESTFAGADYIIRGEGEGALIQLLDQLEAGIFPREKIIDGFSPDLDTLPSPYHLYTAEDIRNRIVYVESSRGCPYRCSFCLSARDTKIRFFPLHSFLLEMRGLLERGVRLFKFTDRTFNVDEDRALEILDFFLKHRSEHAQLHFEIMPDRVSPKLLTAFAAFPEGSLHLEVGIQSTNKDVQKRIKRYQNLEKTWETLAFLRAQTGALLHADLIVGLPDESLESIGEGFDILVKANLQEIQVGLLKRLDGTPLALEDDSTLIFDTAAPYEILETSCLSYTKIQEMKRFARYFDLYYNHGNFNESLNLLWQTGSSPFLIFKDFSEFIWAQVRRVHALSLSRLAELLYTYLKRQGIDRAIAASVIETEFRRLPGRQDVLNFQ